MEEAFKIFLELGKEWGIFASMVIFFVWRMDKRETALRDQVERETAFVRDTLVNLVRQNTTAWNECTHALAALTEKINRT